MATLPIDQNSGNTNGGRRPVTQHPLFPAIVALWFAALLGVGTLIAPVQIIERLVGMTGIANFVPAAEAPLGFTAKAAVALVAACIGALVGLVAARRVQAWGAKPKVISDAYEDADTLDLAGIIAADDLADETHEYAEEEPVASLGRRRPLTVSEEDSPNDFLMSAPLPGDDIPEAQRDHYADVDDFDDFELVAPEIADDVEEEAFIVEADAPEVPVHEEMAEDSFEDEMTVEGAPVELAQHLEPYREADDVLPPPLAFSPPSLAHEPDAMENAQAAVVDEHSAAVPGDAVSRASANLEELGLVQLVQRLGEVLEEHRAWSAQRSANKQAEEQVATPAQREVVQFPPAEPDEAFSAMAAYFGKRATEEEPVADAEQPEAMDVAVDTPVSAEAFQPFANMARFSIIDDDDEDEEDDAGPIADSLSLPLAKSTRDSEPAPAPIAEAGPERDASYRALSAVDNPFRPQAAKPQDADVTVSPRTAAPRNTPANADNDEALRDALLNLQRMAD